MKKVLLILSLTAGNFLMAQSGISCPPGDVTSPSWLNATNKLFSPCPKVKVGIGTPFPSAQMHVVSDEPGISMRLQTVDYNNADLAFQSATGQSDIRYEDPSGNLFGLLRVGTEPGGPSMVFQNRMGGTTTDLFKVSSTGTLYAQELIVRAAPFPDYVFESDYELMPIEELDAYIKKEGHLPNVPSAEEVEGEGLGVSDMLIIHTEKVEELTLYIIQMNEQLKAIQAENKELKTKIEQYATQK